MSTPKQLNYWLKYQLAGKAFLTYQRLSDARKLRALSPKPGSKLNTPLVGTARMKELMSRHYLQGRFVDGVKKVAWVTSGAPIEILRALDFFLIYPENHAALCGARKKAEALAVEAENAGYSHDLCSYARTDIGAVLSNKYPLGQLPRPDLLLACTNICQTVLYWYRVLAAHFNVPLFIVDTPFLYQDAQDHQVQYVKKQLEEMIPVAERVAGKSLSYAKLLEVTERGRECAELWLTIMNRAMHRPSPITAFDGFINMGPIVDLRGEPETLQFYRSLLSEIDSRIKRGIGAVENEQKRVLWDNLPIWYKIGYLSRFLADRGVNVVSSTYTYAWGELAPLMAGTEPLSTMARVYLHPVLNRSTSNKLESMKRMVDKFQLDGAILHSNRSCKPYSIGQLDQRDRLVNQLGVPALLLEADHNDPRAFSEKQVDTRLEAFVEMMEGV